jgi:transmembrane sensor
MEGPIDDSAMFELLGRHLAGECSPSETAMLENWLAAAPENQQSLEALKAIWSQAPQPDPQVQARTDAAWSRMQQRMQASAASEGDPAEVPEMPATPAAMPLLSPQAARKLWMWRAAAMLMVALSVSLIFFLNQSRKNPETELVAVLSGDAPLTDTLPDGTVVYLNAHSRLEYPKAFAAGERVVALDGEGFFEVAHDPAHPFRIHAGDADVRVLGTTFNLSTRGARVRVAVQTGRVELSAADSLPQQPRAKVLLTAGMAGSYDPQRKVVTQEDGEVENDQFWRTRKLIFRDAPMQRVVAQLNAVLEDSIALTNPALGNCHLSTSFDRPSIDSVIAVITETFDLKVTVNGNIYQLDGEGCK